MTIKQNNVEAMNFLESLTHERLSIANLIKTLRECEKMSQVDFAKQLKITRQRLCDIEHGRSHISPKIASEFAKRLSYSESQFVRLALQDILKRDQLSYRVELQAAA